MRNQKARYRTESTTGNRYLQSYNKYLKTNYQPAYDRAKAYQPVVDDAYNTYRTAFDKAKSEYDQLVATEKSAFDAAVAKGEGLAKNVTTANEGYANYKKTNLDPYEAEYASREAALTSARNTAYTAATEKYDTQASSLATAYNTAFDTAAQNYDTQESTLWTAFDTAAKEADKLKKPIDAKWAKNEYVNPITAYDPASDTVRTIDSYEFLGEAEGFKYTWTSKYSGNQFDFTAKQAPSTYDVSEQFRLQKWVDDYNFYAKTFYAGDAQQYGLPSFVNDAWLKRKEKDIQNYTKSIDIYNKAGEKARAEYQSTLTEYNTYVDKNVTPAQTAYYDFVATSKQDYADTASASQLKAYQDFVATSKSDYATSQADLATTAEAKAVQDYVSVLNTQRGLATDYYNTNVKSQQDAYNTFISNEYNPAKSAYEKIATDTGYVTSRTESQRTKYIAAKDKFDELKAQYEVYGPTLEDLKSKYTASIAGLSGMQEEIDRLQRSVNIDLDPRKSSVRVSSRQTILTSGSKRAGAAR